MKKIVSHVAAMGLSGLMLLSPAGAAEFSRQVTIARVVTTSVSRPANPGVQSIFRIYTTTVGSWGSSSCRVDAADASLDDWALYGLLMRAWKDSLTLSVTVDSSIKIDTTDTVCKIVSVAVL
jgi:hypothetical protein